MHQHQEFFSLLHQIKHKFLMHKLFVSKNHPLFYPHVFYDFKFFSYHYKNLALYSWQKIPRQRIEHKINPQKIRIVIVSWMLNIEQKTISWHQKHYFFIPTDTSTEKSHIEIFFNSIVRKASWKHSLWNFLWIGNCSWVILMRMVVICGWILIVSENWCFLEFWQNLS